MLRLKVWLLVVTEQLLKVQRLEAQWHKDK
jgi:hypothetical protein